MTIADTKQAALQEEWRARVDKVLKGADFETKLVSRSFDGVPVGPLYPAALSESPRAIRMRHARWGIFQRIDHADPDAAHAAAQTDLGQGADGLVLVGAHAPGAFGVGISDLSASSLERILGGALAPGLSLRLETGPEGIAAARALRDIVARHGLSLARVTLDLGIDPLAEAAAPNGDGLATDRMVEAALTLLPEFESLDFTGRIFLADGRPAHAAGASEAQELAFTIAKALAILRATEAKGHSLEKARRLISFALAADSDLILTLSKFRALRRLWARIESACGLEPAPIHVHGETAWRMMTRRDPFNNVLRATTAALAAGLGGADSLTILPFTQALGLPDELARRIARNTHLILLEEARLGWVDDPAAGSGAFESLTESLAEKAWTLFRDIEAAGGLGAALAAGSVQSMIGKTRADRASAAAKRRLPIIGTSAFPNPDELPVGVLTPVSDLEPLTVGGDASVASLSPTRLSASFESLYAFADELTQRAGKRPVIFLANFGKRSDFAPRAAFAQNFFASTGFHVAENEGFATNEALVAAYQESGAFAACLCSSDAAYGEQAASVAKGLAAAGCSHIILAGKPGDAETAYRDAGIESFIFAGCDGLAYPAVLLKNKAETLTEAAR